MKKSEVGPLIGFISILLIILLVALVFLMPPERRAERSPMRMPATEMN